MNDSKPIPASFVHAAVQATFDTLYTKIPQDEDNPHFDAGAYLEALSAELDKAREQAAQEAAAVTKRTDTLTRLWSELDPEEWCQAIMATHPHGKFVFQDIDGLFPNDLSNGLRVSRLWFDGDFEDCSNPSRQVITVGREVLAWVARDREESSYAAAVTLTNYFRRLRIAEAALLDNPTAKTVCALYSRRAVRPVEHAPSFVALAFQQEKLGSTELSNVVDSLHDKNVRLQWGAQQAIFTLTLYDRVYVVEDTRTACTALDALCEHIAQRFA